MVKIYPVIMAGGTGTRLWPLSTRDNPKQFHPLFNGRSSFAEALERCRPSQAHNLATVLEIADPIIVGAERHLPHMRAACEAAGVSPHMMILEPIGRNTAPVAAIVAELIAREDPEGLVLLTPADQHIADAAGFWSAVEEAGKSATDGDLTIFGIEATRPETGFGYIRKGEVLDGRLHRVDSFVEKPDAQTAQAYLDAGDYFWNAGIFLFKAATMLQEIEIFAPEILQAVRETLSVSPHQGETLLLDRDSFAHCPSRSIDYAIIEHTKRVAVIAPVSVGWNDLGSWQAIAEVGRGEGSDGNMVQGEATLIDSSDCYVRTEGLHVAAIGVENLVIVVTENGVLVSRKEDSQKVRDVVASLEKSDRTDLL